MDTPTSSTLDAADRGRLFAFLGSLGRAEFDADGDHYVDCTDWTALESWTPVSSAVMN